MHALASRATRANSLVVSTFVCASVFVAAAALVACGDDDAAGDAGTTAAVTSATTDGAGGTGGTGGTGGMMSTTGTTGGSTIPMCTAALDEALQPVDEVSDGEVIVLDEAAGVRTIYVDADAGGLMAQYENPWIYVDLATATLVAVTDPEAFESTDWDIAFKRPIIRNNSGVSGPGMGGTAGLPNADFDSVTMATAATATFIPEIWFDEECNLYTDPTGAIKTSFDGWYDYEEMFVSPSNVIFVVRGADGTLYKMEFLDYYANPDGTSGMAGGRYRLRYAAL